MIVLTSVPSDDGRRDPVCLVTGRQVFSWRVLKTFYVNDDTFLALDRAMRALAAFQPVT